jgi:hypothetical protein
MARRYIFRKTNVSADVLNIIGEILAQYRLVVDVPSL